MYKSSLYKKSPVFLQELMINIKSIIFKLLRENWLFKKRIKELSNPEVEPGQIWKSTSGSYFIVTRMMTQVNINDGSFCAWDIDYTKKNHEYLGMAKDVLTINNQKENEK
jgi:hypothetical protein